MVKGARRGDDLFAILPDLPWHRHVTRGDALEHLRRKVRQTQLRASDNIGRQRAATERVRAALATRVVRPRHK